MITTVYNSQENQEQHTLKRIHCTGFDTECQDTVIDMLLVFSDGTYNGLDVDGVATTGFPSFEGKIHVPSIS